ncbi:MAG: ChaN family lipoprotein [Acidobacteriota bacterium]
MAAVSSIRFSSHLLRSIKRQIREVRGPEDEEVEAYYRPYSDFFRHRSAVSVEPSVFLAECKLSSLILVGDFHTLDQAQKTFLWILEEMGKSRIRPIVVLEMVLARHDTPLLHYIRGKIGELEFLEQTRYFDNWGFDFSHYEPIFAYARRWKLAVHGLNQGQSLCYRDHFMAHRLKHLRDRYPGQPLLVLVGDLHLAPAHLPRELAQVGFARPLVLFQNSEAVYMRKLRNGVNPSGWFRLGGGRYLVNNTPPWVKMQTFLTWLEHGGEALCQMYGFCRRGEDPEEAPDLTDTVVRYLDALANLLQVRQAPPPDFEVYTFRSLEFLQDPYFKRGAGRRFAALVRDGRSVYIHQHQILYVPELDLNRTVEEAMHFLMHRGFRTRSSPIAFMARIHYYASGFLASKLINPLRKTPNESQMRDFLSSFHTLAREKDRVKLGRQALVFSRAIEFFRLMRQPLGIARLELEPMLLADWKTLYGLSQQIGYTLGLELYERFDRGELSALDLRRYAFEQQDPLLFHGLRSEAKVS